MKLNKQQTEVPADHEPLSILQRLRARFSRRQLDAQERYHQVAAVLASGKGAIPSDAELEEALASADKDADGLAELVQLMQERQAAAAQVRDESTLRAELLSARQALSAAVQERDASAAKFQARCDAAEEQVTQHIAAIEANAAAAIALGRLDRALDALRFGPEHVAEQDAALRAEQEQIGARRRLEAALVDAKQRLWLAEHTVVPNGDPAKDAAAARHAQMLVDARQDVAQLEQQLAEQQGAHA